MGLIDSAVQFYKYVNEDLSDPRTVNYPFISSPAPILLLTVANLLLTKYGPKLMENRQPFQIDKLIQMYNGLQIILNGVLCIAVIRACYIPRNYSLICQPVGTTTTPEELHIMNLVYFYFMLKVFDILDTVFIVLRKKSNQLSFLHIYHHTGMIYIGWVGVKYVPGGQSMFIGLVNTFVHTVMYSYYLLTLIDPKFRTSWMKKHVTQLQIIQFFLIFVHLSVAVLVPGCKFPSIPIYIVLPCLMSIIKLFVNFYQNEYMKTKHQKLKE